MIATPRAIDTGAPRTQMLVELATLVTETPWALSRAVLARGHGAGLSDDDILHAIALAAFFGHLNRIADAVAVPLDYTVQLSVPAVDLATPAFATAPRRITGRPALDLSARPATARALGEWRSYMFQRDAPLTRRQRTLIARYVAAWLGDGSISPPGDLTANPLDDALRVLAEHVTLAPWKLGPTNFHVLRKNGFDDAALFDACATASIAGVLSRIEVALVSLAS